VEAADDICYTIIDFEDGINLGLVSEDFAWNT
jgi:dGTPase